MCTIITKSETEDARNATPEEAQAQVNKLMEFEQKLKATPQDEWYKLEPPCFEPFECHDCYGLFVWLDNMTYCGTRYTGFYYVRYQNSILAMNGMCTAYEHPAVVIEKAKLTPEQQAFMDRKVDETRHAGRR